MKSWEELTEQIGELLHESFTKEMCIEYYKNLDEEDLLKLTLILQTQIYAFEQVDDGINVENEIIYDDGKPIKQNEGFNIEIANIAKQAYDKCTLLAEYIKKQRKNVLDDFSSKIENTMESYKNFVEQSSI
jgi:hypothetical protein